jgi:hypothetical protein
MNQKKMGGFILGWNGSEAHHAAANDEYVEFEI